jgi:hypothetical protein
MSYSDQSTFPKGSYSNTALSNVAAVVSSTQVKATAIVFGGGAAAEEVIFRRPGAGTEYFRIKVPITAAFFIPGFDFEDGLEILTADAAGDVAVFIPQFSV